MLIGISLLTLPHNLPHGDEQTCTGVRKKQHQGAIFVKILSTVSLPVMRLKSGFD